MNYYDELLNYGLKNIHQRIHDNKEPIVVRFDINSPVGSKGRISCNGEPNLRLEQNGYLIRVYSRLGPLILMAHQGRKEPPTKKQDKNYVNLLDHHYILSKFSGMRIHFVENTDCRTWEEYSKNVESVIGHSKPGEAVLMDNIRFWDFEKKWDKENCPYIPFFEEIGIAAYINDGLPLWHRKDASLMFGRHVSSTYIGYLSMKELRVQNKIMHRNGKKIIIIGGKKPKFEAIPRLAEKMDILTSGITGILTAKLAGNEIGSGNERLLAETFKGRDKEIKKFEKIVNDYNIDYPEDFTLSQTHNTSPSNRMNVSLKDLTKPEYEKYEIFDIGEKTVKKYATRVNTGGYTWKIRAGPSGVFEQEFDNGINLIRRILGSGFVALGGDTVEELQKYELCKPIMYSDGTILLGGGSHLHGFAEMTYPSIEDLIENGSM